MFRFLSNSWAMDQIYSLVSNQIALFLLDYVDIMAIYSKAADELPKQNTKFIIFVVLIHAILLLFYTENCLHWLHVVICNTVRLCWTIVNTTFVLKLQSDFCHTIERHADRLHLLSNDFNRCFEHVKRLSFTTCVCACLCRVVETKLLTSYLCYH